MTGLAFHPLTPDRWDDFVDLFETDSICRGCWCVYHRLSAADLKVTPRDARKAAMRKIVKSGPPPGLLAYLDGQVVGWLALTSRPETPGWNVGRKASAAFVPEDAEDHSTWAASCFFIRRGHRGQGVTTALLDAGVAWAKKEGAKRIDACPMVHEEQRSTVGLFVGPKRVFDRAGFTTLIERKPGRPLMRLELKKRSPNPQDFLPLKGGGAPRIKEQRGQSGGGLSPRAKAAKANQKSTRPKPKRPTR